MSDLLDPAVPETIPAVALPSPAATAAPQAPAPDLAAIPPIAKTAPQAPAPVYSAEWPKITHTLVHPILLTEGAEPIREISIPEPDLETMERVLNVVEALGLTAENEITLSVRHLRPLLVAFTGIPDATIRRIHFKDVNALSEKMGPLLEGLTT